MATAPAKSAIDLAHAYSEVEGQLRRSVVQVRVSEHGGGSGVIWSREGLILTNSHVARGRRAEVELSDGRQYAATVERRDGERDLVALRIDADDLPAAHVRSSETLRVGEIVVALGHPLGVVNAVTAGILLAAGAHRRWLQADIRLAPGNSGGPLADAAGRVIGINSMIAYGRALAIPSAAAERFVSGGPQRARLGVTLEPVEPPHQRFGLLITQIDDASAAERAGLLPGDIIVGADGRPILAPEDLADALEAAATTRQLTVDLLRGMVWQQAAIAF